MIDNNIDAVFYVVTGAMLSTVTCISFSVLWLVLVADGRTPDCYTECCRPSWWSWKYSDGRQAETDVSSSSVSVAVKLGPFTSVYNTQTLLLFTYHNL